jgi:thiamine biosynthesis protein ThiS
LQIELNGEARDIPAQYSLEQLLNQLELGAQKVAVELNRDVVRRDEWARIELREGDRIEIVHFVGGGEA